MGLLLLPDLLHWKVKRIDYAIDLEINQDLIPIYMFVFKQSNIPNYMLSNPITKMFMEAPANLYLYSTNLTINFHNRHSTLEEKFKKGKIHKINLDKVKNKLRLEVQYKKCSGELYEYLSEERCKKIICYFYDSIIGNGHYYQIERSLELIAKGTRSVKRSIELKEFIKYIHQTGSVWLARESFAKSKKYENEKKASKVFSRNLNLLRELNINPVTLTNSSGISMLENLRERINKKFALDESERKVTLELERV